MNILSFSVVFILLTFLVMACVSEDQVVPRTAYLNATIWTENPESPKAEALLVEGDKLILVGTNAEIQAALGENAQVIDAGGAFIVPGFIDAHVHFVTGGFRLSSVQLRDANTPDEFLSRIAAYAANSAPGEWITGGDWDHENWGGELPTRYWIDDHTSNHPVFVSRLDGHMGLANSAALEAAGIDENTEEVFGGEIVRDTNGRPTGILKDNAMDLVFNVMPADTDAQTDRALDAAMAYVNARGITSVHHVGTINQLDIFQRAKASGRLSTRIYAAVQLTAWEQLDQLVSTQGFGDHWLRIGGLKGFVDGSLGSHTAAFFEPFSDEPENAGFFVNTAEDLYSFISAADGAGLHPIIHAIGDRANHELLNIFERVAQENGPRDRRFRIEHAQHLRSADMERFESLGVIPSMQPYHAIDDGRWAERVIGPERIKTTYAFRSLLDAGARIAFGSDWFVAPPTPLDGIYAAVTRRTLDDANPDGWVPEEKITVEEALRAYTLDAAFASFEDDIKGSLEPGKLADFVLLDKDLTKIPPESIRETNVLKTVIGGRVVYEASE